MTSRAPPRSSSDAHTSKNVRSYGSSLSSGATETMALAINQNTNAVALIGGSKTTGDTLTVTVYDAGISGGSQAVTYTVASTDTLTSIASGLASAITSNSTVKNIGVSATSSGTVVTIQSNSTNPTTYRQSTSSGATETIGLTVPTFAFQTAVIGGTKTTGNVLTITVYDSSLSGGKEVVNYTVASGDTINSIATNLASAITSDSNLSAIGVSASASGPVVSILSNSPNLTTYAQSLSSGATETITMGATTGVTQSLYNNVNELVAQAPGGNAFFQGTTNKALQSASVAGQAISIKQAALNPVTFSESVAGTPTETASLTQAEGNATITIGGTITAGDVISLTVTDATLSLGTETVSYKVKSTDTTSSVASGLGNAVSSDGNLNGFLGTSISSNVLTITPNGDFAVCRYAISLTGVPTETIAFGPNTNGNATATVGGTVTSGNVLTLTVSNENLTNGQETVSYTATGGDTTTSIATALKNAVNADSNLQGIGVSATSSGAVVSLATAGTTYTESVGGSATETITLGTEVDGNVAATIGGTLTTGDSLTITTHNALLSGGQEAASYTVLSTDSLVTAASGLAAAMNSDAHLQGLGVSASNTNAQSLAFSRAFSGNGTLPSGASFANASGVDGGGTIKTGTNSLLVKGAAATALTFDANGNMTSDGTNQYSWDCENRLIKVTYPGTNNFSTFVYDALDRNVSIVPIEQNRTTPVHNCLRKNAEFKIAQRSQVVSTAMTWLIEIALCAVGDCFLVSRKVLISLGPSPVWI